MRTRTKRATAALLAATAIAAGCGSDDDAATDSTSTTAAGTEGTEGGGGGTSDPDAILRFSAIVGPSQDPIRQAHTCEPTTLNAIFDTLFAIDADGELEPRLATEYEEAAGNILRLTLRDAVVFQDGTPFNAEAVRFNIERAKTDPGSTIASVLADVESVTVVDDLTVDIQMARPVAGNLLAALSGRAGMMASPTAVEAAGSSEAFSAAPVGAGMYAIDGEWLPRESLTVRTWDGYWDTEDRLLGGIDFLDVAFDARPNAIQSGDLDVSMLDSVATARAVEGSDGLTVEISESPQYRLFVLNETTAPLDILEVRQAISFAIDRQAVADAMTLGESDAAYQQFPTSSAAYDESLSELYPYDPDRARELLEEAGFADGFDLQAAVGSASPSYIQVGEIIASQLAEVGINMNIELLDQSQAFSQIVTQGAFPASPFGGVSTRDPGRDFRDHFFAEGGINAGDNEPDGLRELIEEAGASVDSAERAELFQEANRLVVEEVQDGVPIYFDPSIFVYRDGVNGIEPGQVDCDFSFRGVSIDAEA